MDTLTKKDLDCSVRSALTALGDKATIQNVLGFVEEHLSLKLEEEERGLLKDLVKDMCRAILTEAAQDADSGSDGSMEDVSEDEDDAASKKRRKVKAGKAAVDESFPDKNSYHVFEAQGQLYTATLSKTNLAYNQRGSNKFYIIQLLRHDDKDEYVVFTKWGRVGAKNPQTNLWETHNAKLAIGKFTSIFYQKTKNVFGKKFVKSPKAYGLVETIHEAGGSSATASGDSSQMKKLGVSEDIPSRLPSSLQSLMSFMFDPDMQRRALENFNVDLVRQPLGKLSAKQLTKGFMVLSQLEEEVKRTGGRAVTDRMEALSNEFYSTIPHDFGMRRPPAIATKQQVIEKLSLLETLGNLEAASKLMLGADKVAVPRHPNDFRYSRLGCQMLPVKSDSPLFSILARALTSTHAPDHKEYSLKIVDAFRIGRLGEKQRFAPFEGLKRQWLWHGSRTANYVGILSQGLRIAPSEAPSTGSMFGKGIYFSDSASKAANYCHATPRSNQGLLLLCDTAIGRQFCVTKAKNFSRPPLGFHSVKGLGRFQPPQGKTSPLHDMEDQDVELQWGAPGEEKGPEDSELKFNEYVIYDEAQVALRYLLRVEFQFNGN